MVTQLIERLLPVEDQGFKSRLCWHQESGNIQKCLVLNLNCFIILSAVVAHLVEHSITDHMIEGFEYSLYRHREIMAEKVL